MSKSKNESDFFQFLALTPYRLLGDRITHSFPFLNSLESKLPKANMKIAFQAYISLIIFFSLLGFSSIFVLMTILNLIFGATLIISVVVAFVLGLVSGLVIFVSLFVYPSMQVGNRKRILDEELPYVASHMGVLSKANLPPERIFRSMTYIEAMGMKSIAAEESKNVIRDVNLLGYDIISAIEERVRCSPSPRFVDFLDGFISVTRSGGDLTAFFMASARGLMDSARIAARQLVETLGAFAEAYVSVMVVFPLLVIVMLSIMGIIGGGIAGFGVLFIMQLVTYLIIPAFALMLLLFLDSIMPPR